MGSEQSHVVGGLHGLIWQLWLYETLAVLPFHIVPMCCALRKAVEGTAAQPGSGRQKGVTAAGLALPHPGVHQCGAVAQDYLLSIQQ